MVGANGTDLFRMLQLSFAWVASDGFPSPAHNSTLKFPVVVSALEFAPIMVQASTHHVHLTSAPLFCLQ